MAPNAVGVPQSSPEPPGEAAGAELYGAGPALGGTLGCSDGGEEDGPDEDGGVEDGPDEGGTDELGGVEDDPVFTPK